MRRFNKKSIWIGLAEVHAVNKNGKDNLNGFAKGFVNVLALATTRYTFRKRVKTGLENIGLDLKRLEDVELFKLRIKKFDVEEKIKLLAQKIDEKNFIQFGDFYVFES